METAWNRLNREISSCRRCEEMAATESKPVCGVGNPQARIIIVGLAPGKDGANLTGIPFTRDPSGELLNQMLSVAGLSRSQDVFITNLVKCNPKDARSRNRTPSKNEIRNCFPYLKQETECMSPRIMVTLGRLPTELLLGLKIKNMIQIHGKPFPRRGILFFPFIHPAYVIRGAYDKRKYLERFKVIGNIFRDLIQQESQLSRLDILLLLIRNGSHSGSEGLIKDKTRLQKLLFLVQKELINRGYKAKYAFRPYKYGPFSRELYTDLEWLRMNNLVEVRTNFDQKTGVTTEFAITSEGKNRLCNLNSFSFENIDETIKGVVEEHERLSTTQLVDLVHEKYKEYDINQVQANRKRADMKLDDFIRENRNLN
jgi:uracil-DNA glycosylase family 4